MSLVVRLLGSYSLTWNGQPLALPQLHKARLLLSHLLLEEGRAIARERLVGLFWPERPEAAARRALSQALWQIRQALGPAADRVQSEGERVALVLQPADYLDVAEFRALYRALEPSVVPSAENVERLHRALALYQGDLLEGYYEDWVLFEQERLRECYLHLLDRLLMVYKQRGEYNLALTCALRLVAADPLREETHCELMRLYHLLGRPRAALDQYETLRRLLRDELQTTPLPATKALYREIVASWKEKEADAYLPLRPASPPILQDLNRLPLIGRENERLLLTEALQSAARGQNRFLLIRGEVGIGKSRLVEQLAAEADWCGIPVGLGRADPTTTTRPYHLLRDTLHSLLNPLRLGQLTELLEPYHLNALSFLLPQPFSRIPDLPVLPPEKEHERLCQAVGRCLEVLSPLVLILEDLHWADELTLDVLSFLPSRLHGGILLLITFRSGEAYEREAVWQTLEILERQVSWQHLFLQPLNLDQMTTLVRQSLNLHTQVEPFVRRLWTESGGNPLLTIEILKALLDEGLLSSLSDGTWRLPDPALPWPSPVSLRNLVAERIARLSPAERAILEALAILTGQGDFVLLSHLLETEPATLLTLLRDLVRRGFLQEKGDGYTFEHGQIHQVIYQAITPNRRRHLHRRAGEVLETLHPEWVETLLYHFERAGEREKAAHYYLRAGDQVCSHSPLAALEHYERALELTPAQDLDIRWAALDGKMRALTALSRGEEQAAVLEEMEHLAEEKGDPGRLARVRYERGWLEVVSGDPLRALSLLHEGIDLARRAEQTPLLGHCYLAVATACWRTGRGEACREAAEEAGRLFHQVGDQDGISRALNMLGTFYLSFAEDYERALACFEENLHLNRRRGHLYREMVSLLNTAIARSKLGDYRRALTSLDQVVEATVRLGTRNLEGIARLGRGICYRALGAMEQAREEAKQTLAICLEVGDHNFALESWNLLGAIALEEGRYAEACANLRQGLNLAHTYHQQRDAVLLTAFLALACLRAGEEEEAGRLATQAMHEMERWDEPYDRQDKALFACYQVWATLAGPEKARPALERAYALLLETADRIQNPLLRRSFLGSTEHQAIITAYRLDRPPPPLLRQCLRLPCAGRPPSEGKQVEVTWTLSDPEDGIIGSHVMRRRHRLQRLLRQAEAQGAAPTIRHLMEALGVSRATVKRDLAALRQEVEAKVLPEDF